MRQTGKSFFRRLAAGLVLAAGCAGAAHAAYPERPIRIIVGFAAGGPADASARLAARILTESLGQSVVVENRVGAGGGIATLAVKQAPGDGYTLLLAAFADVLNPIMNPEARYNLANDFKAVTRITGVGNVLMVHPSLPVKDLQELLALARKNPGTLNYGSAGVGSAGHLAGELMAGLAKVKLTHVPYKGTAQAQVDLLQGAIPFMFDSQISALPNQRSGKLNALAVTTSVRSPGAPGIPTMAEAGLPGYDLTSWFGVVAPAGTPAAVVETLAAALREGLKRKEARDSLAMLGGAPDDMSPAEFQNYIRSENARWRTLFGDGTVRVER
ncbi:Bug family tripartite tricarboxylate transporter substrate binding protein [Variovorax terrae]|uniref:Tripartite tricarboxylate transporter substrate binding protein n=1 Tax=Variovorax terrae TaxID=2923278 RepID=A0A9X1VVY5_9BURK|nr:tripartite tricarboxylate transporter substrate binding protein [Variovorax terrae]MCJ0764382.1 tripartite tricarboxylate transporter substrate binding protein [Variovorax terrae]